jgi:cytoskeleton protein RodZ
MKGRTESEGGHFLAGDGQVAADRGIGETLRAERERRRVSLESLAKALKISQVHLAAIEEGRLQDLPGKTYAIGFIRSYAKHFDLDPEEVLAAVKAWWP